MGKVLSMSDASCREWLKQRDCVVWGVVVVAKGAPKATQTAANRAKQQQKGREGGRSVWGRSAKLAGYCAANTEYGSVMPELQATLHEGSKGPVDVDFSPSQEGKLSTVHSVLAHGGEIATVYRGLGHMQRTVRQPTE